MSEEEPQFRSMAIELLELYASPDAQRKYQRDVPFVSVAVELVCKWFDDFWCVEDEPPVAAHAAEWNASIERFSQCFTAEEMIALKEFHQFFEVRVDDLPDDLEALLCTPSWQEIMGKARKILEVFRKLG